MNRYITIGLSSEVKSIRLGSSIAAGEIQSDTGELGQIMQPDGTFITPEPVPSEPQVSLEEMQMQTLLNTEYLVIMSELTNL